MIFKDFFHDATGFAPLPYQEALSEGPWPDLLDIPTGLGKTAAVILAFLFRRLTQPADTPRRLVYCLPSRVLVRQSAQNIDTWLEKLSPTFATQGQRLPTRHMLLGGDIDTRWELHPEAPAIIVGTQDLLISRALNRGYAMSRYRWPIHFAMLNNDCLWIFDETQLMGVAIETSAQLQAFRDELETTGATHSLWMSATLGSKQLCTVDHPTPSEGFATHTLSVTDRGLPLVAKRLTASKPIAPIDMKITKERDKKELKAFAIQVLSHHDEGTRTLVIVNRVARAQLLHGALLAAGRPPETTLLIHSRFRPHDRARLEDRLHDEGDLIIVATQALEAGVDVSAKTLITELAPWPSLIQRFGRCNRYGEHADASIRWIDLDEEGHRGACALPYAPHALAEARERLHTLTEASPDTLSKVPYAPRPILRPILRRKDLLELFDTTPDLSGNDVDISRYVRDGQDMDVHIYWRTFEGAPSNEDRGPHRDELCAVPLGAARDFVTKVQKKGPHRIWRWDHLERRWQRVTSKRGITPGCQLLVSTGAGGYHPEVGWTGESNEPVPPIMRASSPPLEAYDADHDTEIHRWLPLQDHVAHVRDEVADIGSALALNATTRRALEIAATWHDLGKAHESFQRMLVEGDPERQPPDRDTVWAKSSHNKGRNTTRPGFRHELGAALLYLQRHPEAPSVDLIAYLIASHHGKVRLSIRSLPTEKTPPSPHTLFARGWHDGDLLPPKGPLTLVDGTIIEPSPVELTPLRLGAGSWLERMLALLDDLGPFRLAYLETILRSGDGRASALERGEHA